MLSGAEEGAQGAPFESYKLAAVRLAEAVRLASRGDDSENDMVLELSGAVNLFLRETGIALAFGNALEDLEGVPNFGARGPGPPTRRQMSSRRAAVSIRTG